MWAGRRALPRLAFVGGVGVLAYRHVLRRRTGAVGRWSVRDLLWVAAGIAFGVLLTRCYPTRRTLAIRRPISLECLSR